MHEALELWRKEDLAKKANPQLPRTIDATNIVEIGVAILERKVAEVYGEYMLENFRAVAQELTPIEFWKQAEEASDFANKKALAGEMWKLYLSATITANEGGKYTSVLESLRDRAIDYGKTGSLEKEIDHVKTSLTNYMSHHAELVKLERDHVIYGTEVSHTCQITDPFTGELLPLPVKGKIDLIAETMHGKGLLDYKTVAKYSDDSAPNPQYELQAGIYYFVYFALTGQYPDVAVFEEVPKKAPGVFYPADPGSNLYQADLDRILAEHGIDPGVELGKVTKFVKNDEKKEILAARGILVKEPPVKQVVYRYSERPDILRNFLEIYRRAVNELYFMTNTGIKALPNPYDMMSGQESWEEFLAEQDEKPKGNEQNDEKARAKLDNFDF